MIEGLSEALSGPESLDSVFHSIKLVSKGLITLVLSRSFVLFKRDQSKVRLTKIRGMLLYRKRTPLPVPLFSWLNLYPDLGHVLQHFGQ